MKTWWKAALCLLGLLCLTGCGAAAPETAADGTAWSEEWVTVGDVVGVETPEGMTPRENSDALSAKGMYYATWSLGEAETIVNESGDEAQLYDAQVYLLLAGYDGTEKAEEAAAEWLDMAAEQYAVEASRRNSQRAGLHGRHLHLHFRDEPLRPGRFRLRRVRKLRRQRGAVLPGGLRRQCARNPGRLFGQLPLRSLRGGANHGTVIRRGSPL